MRTPFRGFRAILYKEFIVVLRDPLTLFFMFFPPLIQIIAFGFALDTDVKHMAMVVFDEDRTAREPPAHGSVRQHADVPRRGRSAQHRANWRRRSGAARPTWACKSRPISPATCSRAATRACRC